MMDWQSILAAGIAMACGIFVLREFVRPFLAERSGGCHGCTKAGTGAFAGRGSQMEMFPVKAHSGTSGE